MTPPSDSPGKSHDVTLAGMPDRVLLKIWLCFEKPQDFVTLCKSIRAFTQRVDIRAQYFVARYGTHLAMFRAIARPAIFDEALCQSLLQCGAVISLALMQELATSYFSSQRFGPYATKCGWSAKLSMPAVLAILSEGAKTYPKLQIAETSEMKTFHNWFFDCSNVADEAVADMFLQRDFVPLPSTYFPFPKIDGWNSSINKILAVTEYTVAQRQACHWKRRRLEGSNGTVGDSQPSADMPLAPPQRQTSQIRAGTETHRARFDRLPDELLTRILVLSPDPTNLSGVSKRLYKLSQSCHMRAQRFLRRHGRGLALFYAIARPRIFTEELFKTLLTMGATLPLALAQELVIRNFRTSARGYHCFDARGGGTAWGKHVALQAVLSVLAEAHRRYSSLHLHARDLVEYYECATERESWDARAETRAKFRSEYKTLFEEHNFVPLPFGRRNADDDDRQIHGQYLHDLRNAMIRWPELALWLGEQDVHLPQGKDGILPSSLRNMLHLHEATSLRVQCFEQAHKSGHPSLTIDESLLTRVIMSLRWRKPAEKRYFYSDRRIEPAIAHNIFFKLYSKGVFDLDFPALWERAILTLAQQESGVYAARIYRFVISEIDDASTPFKLARWFAYFLLRQAHSAGFVNDLPLKSIKARDWTQANSDRTADDILGVLLLPAIVDETGVLAYAKTHALVHDWPQFLTRAARCLLLDPFKGKLLKAISGWCKAADQSHFPAILARAVENHAISGDLRNVTPGDVWHLSRDAKGRRLQQIPPCILTVLSCNERRQPSEELYMPGRTVQQGIALPLEDYTTFEQESTMRVVPNRFQRTADRGHMDLGDLWTSASERPDPHSPDALRAPFMEKLEHNGLAIVKLCGSSSAAAAIVMDHAVLSYKLGPTSLLGLLVKAGCTFTVRHLYMLDGGAREHPQELRQALLTLQVEPLSSQEDEEALLSSLAVKHVEDTQLQALGEHIAEALKDSPDGAIDLIFHCDETGTVTCAPKAMTPQEGLANSQEGRRSFWQPPAAVRTDLQSAKSTMEPVGEAVTGKSSSESLTQLPQDDVGDPEDANSDQYAVSRPSARRKAGLS